MTGREGAFEGPTAGVPRRCLASKAGTSGLKTYTEPIITRPRPMPPKMEIGRNFLKEAAWTLGKVEMRLVGDIRQTSLARREALARKMIRTENMLGDHNADPFSSKYTNNLTAASASHFEE